MSKYVRVLDKDTGHKLSVFEAEVSHGNYSVLSVDAVDSNGDPLPPEFKSADHTEKKGA